jgi:hypothetical protein
MNSLNEQRAQKITEQLFSLKSDEVTPTTDFTIDPQYTLIAHLPEHINSFINAVVSELKTRFPKQYYYSPSQYHLTVVPIPRSLSPVQVIESIAPIITDWRLPIHARGVAANRLQAGTVLYPQEETLVSQRIRLRAALGILEQAYTAHKLVWDELLWVNFMRFTTKPEEELLEFLRSRASQDFGSFELSRYELYELSTKTLDPASSKLLHTFDA